MKLNQPLTTLKAGGVLLFEQPTQIARRLMPLKGYKDLASLTSALGQAIQGKRSCPLHLQEPLIEYVRERLAEIGQDPDESVVDEVRSVIGQKRDKTTRTAKCARADFNAVLESVSSCEAHFAIVPEDIETSPCGQQVLQIVLDRVAINPDRSKPTRFELCFAGPERGIAFLDQVALIISANTGLGLQEAWALLAEAEREGRLMIYSLPAQMCAFPALISDPDNPKPVGFNLYVYSGESPSLCKMPPEAVDQWRRYVYLPLRLNRIPEFKEVRIRSSNQAELAI